MREEYYWLNQCVKLSNIVKDLEDLKGSIKDSAVSYMEDNNIDDAKNDLLYGFYNYLMDYLEDAAENLKLSEVLAFIDNLFINEDYYTWFKEWYDWNKN